jgi:flagellar basal body-associated protein FliL
MAANDARTRSRSVLLLILAAGVTLALAGNVYQFTQARRLAHDLAFAQERMARRFAEIREVESGALEQNLRRLDELNKQFEQVTAATLEQARSEVRRNRAELAKALDERRKEVARQMSDLKSDLKEETSTKVEQVSTDLAKTRVSLERAVADVNGKTTENPPSSEAPAITTHAVVPDPKPAEQAPKKKSFWSRLNPFKKDKSKPDVASK